MFDLSIIIPAYNEEKRILPTLKDAVDFLSQNNFRYEILVIDDGSFDKTAEVVKTLNLSEIYLISHKVNQGKGSAVKRGVKDAKGDWILFIDADGATPIKALASLWAERHNYDLLIGSRYLAQSNLIGKQPFFRRFVSRLGNFFIRLILGCSIKDTQCGFKLFSKKAAKTIFSRLTIQRWGFDLEVIVLASKYGFRIKEVPVEWRNISGSKFRSSIDVGRTLAEVLRIKWNLMTKKYDENKG